MRAGQALAPIQRVNQQFVEAFARHDAGAVAALYAAGARVLPPHNEMLKESDAIRAFWQEVMDAGIARATLESVDLEEAGDTAIELGQYTLMLADGTIADEGKYLVVWKQQDGTWKIYRDIWNTSQALAG
jgi:uncharacterized protein (TIGR02246 family)